MFRCTVSSLKSPGLWRVLLVVSEKASHRVWFSTAIIWQRSLPSQAPRPLAPIAQTCRDPPKRAQTHVSLATLQPNTWDAYSPPRCATAADTRSPTPVPPRSTALVAQYPWHSVCTAPKQNPLDRPRGTHKSTLTGTTARCRAVPARHRVAGGPARTGLHDGICTTRRVRTTGYVGGGYTRTWTRAK